MSTTFPGWCYFLAVIDMRVRPHVTRYLDSMGRALSAIGMTPAAMTGLGLAMVIAGSVMVATGRLVSGAWVIGVGSLLDGLDGAVARASGKVSARGAFLDSAFDRVGEIAAFAGLAFAMEGQARILLLIVLSVGGAMLVPYMRARAEAEGLDGTGGLMGRSERLLLFCSGLIFAFIEPMLWIFVVLVWLTALTRFLRSYRSIE
ncbi:MAG TPA: CDP-alcohol phosphatidyltransferase family protein [Acidimicrobiia bacterium]|nr:CDP-alcohol phosphatidyltransferase family protein [Acidimicrobiia bacterium]